MAVTLHICLQQIKIYLYTCCQDNYKHYTNVCGPVYLLSAIKKPPRVLCPYKKVFSSFLLGG